MNAEQLFTRLPSPVRSSPVPCLRSALHPSPVPSQPPALSIVRGPSQPSILPPFHSSNPYPSPVPRPPSPVSHHLSCNLYLASCTVHRPPSIARGPSSTFNLQPSNFQPVAFVPRKSKIQKNYSKTNMHTATYAPVPHLTPLAV
jgi:hypothetical protein